MNYDIEHFCPYQGREKFGLFLCKNCVRVLALHKKRFDRDIDNRGNLIFSSTLVLTSYNNLNKIIDCKRRIIA